MKNLCIFLLSAGVVAAQNQSSAGPDQDGFQWTSALFEAFGATAIAHTVRVTTEDDTKSELGGRFWTDYIHSVENFHGYNDGDAFYTTYLVHPMEGATAGFIEQQNDPVYRAVEFGSSERYWISRMRALAFSAAYSTQWTMGPISEASIGNVQHYAPPGLNDLIVTPILGIGWMVGEDAIDKYAITWFERHYRNPIVLLLARSTLNPTRSYANLLRFKVPWYRDSRPGILHRSTPDGEDRGKKINNLTTAKEPTFDATAWPKSIPFELEADPLYERFLRSNAGNCIGGDGRGAIRVSSSFALVFDVGGCEVIAYNVPETSGDTLHYLAGLRYSRPVAGAPRLRSYVQGLTGGMKITHDYVDDALRNQLTELATKEHQPPPTTPDYTTELDTNRLSVEMGIGLSWILNNAAVIRLCRVEYQHSWSARLAGLDYGNGLELSTGMTFRLGWWGERQ